MNNTSGEQADVSRGDGEQGAAAAASQGEMSAGNLGGTAGAPSFWKIKPMPEVVDAFLLGWKIVELRDRVRVAAALTGVLREPGTGQHDPAATELGEPIWMTSIWHANFKQIAGTHANEFANTGTRGTLYEPPGGHWEKSIPYLYPELPDPADDYTAIGIGPGAVDGVTLPTDFSIYDVTRRGLNALVILYARSRDSVIETTIEAYKNLLFQQMSQAGVLEGVVANASPEDREKLRRSAVARLSSTLGELLDDWASFLREQYYAGAITAEGATKLQAFEAGRNLAQMTWSVSAETIDLEISNQSSDVVLAKWQKVFSPYRVVQAQHFIMALCGAMDDQYYLAAGSAVSATAADANGPLFDPGLPSSMGTAIARCLDHWQAGVAWLQQSQHAVSLPFYKHLRVALIEQSDVWQSLLTGRRRLDRFTVESVMSRLAQNALTEIEDEMVRDVGRAAAAGAGQNIRAWIRTFWPVALVVGVALLVTLLLLIVVAWFVISHPNQLNGTGAWVALSIGSVGAWAAALLGLRGTGGGTQPATPTQSAENKPGATSSVTLLDRVGDVMGLIEASVTSSFRAAYAQLHRELAALNYGIGVSYPLIESFVLHNEPQNTSHEINAIQDDFSFMTKVIWTNEERSQEIQDVVRAALGPVGLLSGVAVRSKSASAAASRAAQPTDKAS